MTRLVNSNIPWVDEIPKEWKINPETAELEIEKLENAWVGLMAPFAAATKAQNPRGPILGDTCMAGRQPARLRAVHRLLTCTL